MLITCTLRTLHSRQHTSSQRSNLWSYTTGFSHSCPRGDTHRYQRGQCLSALLLHASHDLCAHTCLAGGPTACFSWRYPAPGFGPDVPALSRHGRHQQVRIHVFYCVSFTLSHRCPIRAGRSLIHEYEGPILYGLEVLLGSSISFPRTQAETAAWSERDPYFSGCVGAADGTLIPFRPRGLDEHEAATWLCRKKFSAMNVLVAIRHDRTFSFVASGFEGQVRRMKYSFKTLTHAHMHRPVHTIPHRGLPRQFHGRRERYHGCHPRGELSHV